MKIFYTLIISLLLFSCKSTEQNPEFDQKVVEPDPFKRARQAAESGGGIFNLDKKNQESVVNFATSNVLWRATLKSLDFLPLLNADYTGGIIITDWYNEKINSKESIKLTIKFLSNEIRSDSIEIIAHKKFCETIDRCQIGLLDKKFSEEIKDTIITNARAIKIAEEKKKK